MEYRTKKGAVLSDADIEALAAEAEQGYDVRRLRGRPRLGAEPMEAVPVRFPPEMKARIERCVEALSTSLSEYVREAVRERLDRDGA